MACVDRPRNQRHATSRRGRQQYRIAACQMSRRPISLRKECVMTPHPVFPRCRARSAELLYCCIVIHARNRPVLRPNSAAVKNCRGSSISGHKAGGRRRKIMRLQQYIVIKNAISANFTQANGSRVADGTEDRQCGWTFRDWRIPTSLATFPLDGTSIGPCSSVG